MDVEGWQVWNKWKGGSFGLFRGGTGYGINVAIHCDILTL